MDEEKIMFKECDILNERTAKILREPSKEVIFPMNEKEKDLMGNMVEYLRLSQDEEYKMEDGSFIEYKVVNPRIISHSEERIYVEEGEGCLSVTHDIEGIVPRYARSTIEFYDEKGNIHTERVREEISVAFQHEIDHLNGIIYIDKIDRNNPFKDKDNMRAI